MNVPNLKKSIIVIVVLMVMIVIDHLLTLLKMDKTWISMIANVVLLLLNIIYFLQLQNNLNKLQLTIHIRHKINAIIISYIVIIAVIVALAIINRDNPNPKPDGLHTVLFLIYLITYFNLIFQYSVLGYRLTKNNSFPYLRRLGYLYLYLKPLTDLFVLVFLIFNSLKIYAHLSVFSEAIPLWIVYKLYNELIAKENTANELPFITNAAFIKEEETNTPTEITT